jgi:hypothetical protein
MVIVWIGSHWRTITWEHEVGEPYFRVGLGAGSFSGSVSRKAQPSIYPWRVPTNRINFWGRNSMSWAWLPSARTVMSGVTVFVLPLWMPLLVVAMPAAWMWRVDVKRRRAAREGCCAKCGYFLVGTPADRPCPECGTAKG